MNANWLHTTFSTLTQPELATTFAWENHHLNGSTKTLWRPLWLFLKIDILLQQKYLKISVWQSYTISPSDICIIWNSAQLNYINIAQFPQ
jgi:hypothetical protein